MKHPAPEHLEVSAHDQTRIARLAKELGRNPTPTDLRQRIGEYAMDSLRLLGREVISREDRATYRHPRDPQARVIITSTSSRCLRGSAYGTAGTITDYLLASDFRTVSVAAPVMAASARSFYTMLKVNAQDPVGNSPDRQFKQVFIGIEDQGTVRECLAFSSDLDPYPLDTPDAERLLQTVTPTAAVFKGLEKSFLHLAELSETPLLDTLQEIQAHPESISFISREV